MNRSEYLVKFSKYPDIVTIDLFCRMLGGIGDGTARKLLRGNHVEHFYIRNTYFIPKVSIIDYLLSSDYETYKTKLNIKQTPNDQASRRNALTLLLFSSRNEEKQKCIFSNNSDVHFLHNIGRKDLQYYPNCIAHTSHSSKNRL